MTEHFVYILECADGTLYTGYATDVERRVKEHNGEAVALGAKYTSGRRPVRLVYTESHSNRSSAQKREYEIKRLSKKAKQLLIAQS